MFSRRETILLLTQTLLASALSTGTSSKGISKTQRSGAGTTSKMDVLDLIIEHDKEDVETAQIFVEGAIGGHSYRFLLDTGAARTTVPRDGYTLKFEAIKRTGSAAVFARSHEELIVVPSVSLGPFVKTNFEVARAALGEPGAPSLLGMDFIKSYCCHFLFDEQRLLVDSGGEPGTSHAFRDLFLDKTFHPYVDVHLGERSAQAVWDSGAGITIADMKFIDKHPDSFQQAGWSYGTDASGHRQQTPLFIMGASMIGGRAFPPHKVAGVDLSQANATIEVPMDLILGYTTLSKANWLFDFPHKRWSVTKMLGVGNV